MPVHSIHVRSASPLGDESISALLESSFGRTDAESRLARELAANHPAYDEELSLIAEVSDLSPTSRVEAELAGWALFLQRRVWLRGVEVALGASAPIAVSPLHQGRGVGQALLRAGHEALLVRGARGALALGDPQFFSRAGYRTAFDMHVVRTPVEYLPLEGDTSAWRALHGDDLERLCELHAASYATISGSERRDATALDWESLAQGSHTLVHDVGEGARAYVRFGTRNGPEILEAGVESPEGIEAVLCLLQRLGREHGVSVVQSHLAPTHPVGRALFHRGGMHEHCNFGGAAQMIVLDWQGLWEDLTPWWAPILRGTAARTLELGFDGHDLRLDAKSRKPRVTRPKGKGPAFVPPVGWGPGLVSGQRDGAEALLDPAVRASSRLDRDGRAAVTAIFRPTTAEWRYSPIYELAE